MHNYFYDHCGNPCDPVNDHCGYPCKPVNDCNTGCDNMNDCNPIKPIPPTPPICPVPLIPENMTLLEQMRVLRDRQNMCIKQWNDISKNCYAALNQMIEAARINDVYYSNNEVKFEPGYSQDEGCEYAIIRKKVVDKCGKPIRVRLALAFDNTTNSGVKQSIFDASYIHAANVIISAIPYNSNAWSGPALQNGQPVAYTPNTDGYIYGFNRAGVLRYFRGDVTLDSLCQNGMVDVIGGCIPIIDNTEILAEAEALKEKASITAIGYNVGTGEVIFFGCSNQNQVGMTGASVAKLLQNMGCSTAVITSIETETAGKDAAGMIYMGQMAFAPTGNNVPHSQAYWYISKCANFKNEFEKEVSDLVQRTGRNMWETYLLGEKVSEFDGRITDVEEGLKQEIQDRIDGDTALGGRIDQEIKDRQEADKNLDDKITAETNRATAAEEVLDQKIEAETDRATAKENELSDAINDEKLRAINRENEIQAALDSEIAKRIAADNDIINSIEQEILARRAADTELRTLIEQVQGQTNSKITEIQTRIDSIVSGDIELPFLKLVGGTLTGPLVVSGADNTITVGRAPTKDMEVATKKYVDDAVQTGGGGTGGDVSKEYVDQQVATLQGEIDEKVAKSGDTMTGALILSGDPTSALGATTKQYADSIKTSLEKQIGDITAGTTDLPYVKKAGDTMTGDLTMGGNSVIKFNDEGSVYNDDTAIVLQSENNGVSLKGTQVKVGTTEGDAVKVSGVADGSLPSDAVNYSQLETTNNKVDQIEEKVNNIEDGTADLAYVKKSGDTMSGTLNFNQPMKLIGTSQATITTVYENNNPDGKRTSRIMMGNDDLIVGLEDSRDERTNIQFGMSTTPQPDTAVNAMQTFSARPDENNKLVMSMNGHRIVNVGNPVSDMDAINKQYLTSDEAILLFGGWKLLGDIDLGNGDKAVDVDLDILYPHYVFLMDNVTMTGGVYDNYTRLAEASLQITIRQNITTLSLGSIKSDNSLPTVSRLTHAIKTTSIVFNESNLAGSVNVGASNIKSYVGNKYYYMTFVDEYTNPLNTKLKEISSIGASKIHLSMIAHWQERTEKSGHFKVFGGFFG